MIIIAPTNMKGTNIMWKVSPPVWVLCMDITWSNGITQWKSSRCANRAVRTTYRIVINTDHLPRVVTGDTTETVVCWTKMKYDEAARTTREVKTNANCTTTTTITTITTTTTVLRTVVGMETTTPITTIQTMDISNAMMMLIIPT